MAKAKPTVEQLWDRPDVSLTEAARITGRAPKTINEWIKLKQVRSFIDGKYTRITTASIKARSEKLAGEQSIGEAA